MINIPIKDSHIHSILNGLVFPDKIIDVHHPLHNIYIHQLCLIQDRYIINELLIEKNEIAKEYSIILLSIIDLIVYILF